MQVSLNDKLLSQCAALEKQRNRCLSLMADRETSPPRRKYSPTKWKLQFQQAKRQSDTESQRADALKQQVSLLKRDCELARIEATRILGQKKHYQLSCICQAWRNLVCQKRLARYQNQMPPSCPQHTQTESFGKAKQMSRVAQMIDQKHVGQAWTTWRLWHQGSQWMDRLNTQQVSAKTQETQAKSAHTQWAEAAKEVAHLQQELVSQKKAASLEHKRLEQDLQTSKQEARRAQSRVNSLEDEVRHLQADREALKVQSATQFQTRENQLKTEFNDKADLFEKIKAGLISRLETVENAQQKVILSRGRLTFELESAKTKMQQLEVANLDLQKKCSSWQSQNEVLRADLHQMQEKAKEAQDLYEQLDQYAEIVDRLREEIHQLSGGL